MSETTITQKSLLPKQGFERSEIMSTHLFNKILKNMAISGMFNYISDQTYIKFMYYLNMKKKLDLNNPKTFNEKLQWLKLNDRNPNYIKMVDKYEVRSYISNILGEEYLIPLIGVYEDANQINWIDLPNQFVIKGTHGSGFNIICKNKEELNFKKTTVKLNNWLKKNWYWYGREWPYKNVKPRIICEKYVEDQSGNDLIDYKFMCFNGEVRCIFVMSNRSSGLNINIYNTEWEEYPVSRDKFKKSRLKISKPVSFDKMLYFAKLLSENIPFLRVDFYEVNGKLYFSELTFYPSSGFKGFNPSSFDEVLGEWLSLPSTIENMTN